MKYFRLLSAMVLMLALVACTKPARNFPPNDTTMRLDSTNLPIVWIEVGGDSIMRDKRIGGYMTIIHNGEGRLNYADTIAHPGQHVDYKGYIAIRHRGNSTYNNSPKKPYSFRTLAEPMWRGDAKKQKVSILGMSKDNNWALLAPYSDRSMIRDLLAFELARPWMNFTPQGRFCELILDGTYYGVFILSEVVSKGTHRLDLTSPGEAGDALTGGYLMEVDCDDDITYTSKHHPLSPDGKPYTDKNIIFQYKAPDYEDLSPVQRNYINSRIDYMENAIAAGQFDKVIDVLSFIDYQLAMELGHNVDAYRLSGKFYKHRDSLDPRFKMALWDMNLAYGNINRLEGWRTDTWVHESNSILYHEKERYLIPDWWYYLNHNDRYTALLKQRWAQYRQANLSNERLMATVDSLANLLTACGAEQRNTRAWLPWTKPVWPNRHVASSHADEIEYIKHWLQERVAWMDEHLK